MPEKSTVLMDANVLTLLIVGKVAEAEIPRCRRTKKYSVDDYRMLTRYLDQFRHVTITPNIATETSNLLGALSGDYLHRARAILAAGLRVWNESYIQSGLASKEPEFNRLGLTDAAILLNATQELEVLTDDFDLYIALLHRGIHVTNFTHLRTAGLL